MYETYKIQSCHTGVIFTPKHMRYPQSDHVLPHWKCVFWCCAKCPNVNIPDQEIDDQYSDIRPSIRFHNYHIIARCTTHGRLQLTDKKKIVSVNRILIQNNQQKYTLEKT